MTAIDRVIQAVGSQAEVARSLNLSHQCVAQWVKAGRVPVRRAVDLEALTGGRVTREELRPDIYPKRTIREKA